MTLAVIFFAMTVALELAALWLRGRLRVLGFAGALLALGLLLAVSIYLMAADLSLASVAFAVLSCYRAVNLARILKGRMHPRYLRRAGLQTTTWLAGAQGEVWLLKIVWNQVAPAPRLVWAAIAAGELAVAAVVLFTVRRHARHAARPLAAETVHGPLPTVTVAVAARNETDSLIGCIKSLLASDYPKLEILVLDDCSQTRRTPEIIRGFAHDGVRFLPGGEPASGWLARNQAYDTLAKAANGEYILFCSTSVRLQADSIRKLVMYMAARQKTMLSILPLVQSPVRGMPLALPIRAAWELLPPRRWLGRPPVISSCWLVTRSALKKSGGFAAVSRMVTPEAYFARRQAMRGAYSFMPGSKWFGVGRMEEPGEAKAAVIRTAYPALHRRPEMLPLAALGLVGSAILPFAMCLYALLRPGYMWTALPAGLAALLMLAAYRQVLLLCYGRSPLGRALTAPLAALLAVIIYHYSMYQYEFGEVVWKERNICIPVMHAVPHLPQPELA